MQYSHAFTASSHGLRKHNTKLTSNAGILFKLIFSFFLRIMVDVKFVSLHTLVCHESKEEFIPFECALPGWFSL